MVETAAFTPGPWKTKRASKPEDGEYNWGIGGTVDGTVQVIAETFGRSEVASFPPAEANAHLISAAPDLYNACKEFIRKVDEGTARSTNSYAEMQAAIAKAENR